MKKLVGLLTVVILLNLTLLCVQYYVLAFSTTYIQCTPETKDNPE